MTSDILVWAIFLQIPCLWLAMFCLLCHSKILIKPRFYLGFMSGLLSFCIYSYSIILLVQNQEYFIHTGIDQLITSSLTSIAKFGPINATYAICCLFIILFIFAIPVILTVFFTLKYHEPKISVIENTALAIFFGTNFLLYLFVVVILAIPIFMAVIWYGVMILGRY